MPPPTKMDKKQKKHLDDLASEYARKRAMHRVHACERCLSWKSSWIELQAGHCHGRGNHTVRWDVRNLVGLCGGCHRYIDSQIAEKEVLFRRLLGNEEYDKLYILANMTSRQSPIDPKLIEIGLKELLKELESGQTNNANNR